MNQSSTFKSSIQRKFLFLRLFIAAVILFVSVVAVFFVQRIADESAELTTTYVPLLREVQELHGTILTESLDGMAALNTIRPKDNENGNMLPAPTLDFSSARAQIENLRSHTRGEGTMSQSLEHVSASLMRFETTFRNVTQARVVAESLEGLEGEEEARAYAETVRLLEQLQDNQVEISSALDTLEEYVVGKINSEIGATRESTKTNQLLITLISSFAVLLTLLVGLLFSNRTIVKPLHELTKTAEEMAEGNLDKRVEINSHDEIGKLAFTYNKMATKLKTSYGDLEKLVNEKTLALERVLKQFETKNADLEKSQIATINLLEDLEDEKEAVEERVQERTRELEREKNKLLQVTGNMRGGGILLDDTQEVVFVNDAAFTMLGISKSTSYNSVLGNFLSHFEGSEIQDHFKRCLAGDTFRVNEIDGHERVYEVFFHHLKNKDVTSGYFILFFDITDAKLLERSKSELVAVASHQLRTPLTAMRGNVEMLIDESFGELNKEQHELLDDIEVSTIRLITMVNEMLDITKIERGDLEMDLEDLNVKEIIDSVIADLQTYAQRHEFTVKEDLPDDIIVHADRVRLRQIFQNLVDNAIKYSNHPGTLDIAAEQKGDTIVLSFKDNGIGVPKNEQSKLFERFYRASNTAKTSSSGSGLGLYIVKSIAEQFGGDIYFESQEGRGTTFFVTLPLIHKS